MWVESPCSWATSAISSRSSTLHTAPPPRLVVFSTETRRERWKCGKSPRTAPRTWSAENIPRSPASVRSITPESAAGAPTSKCRAWLVSWRMISSPGWVWVRYAISLHMVPEGRNSAASLPSRSATMEQSSRTVGSSLRCSSPTSAFAMTSRIAREGRVCVSL